VPASERDLAFVVAETTEVQSVLQSIRKTAGNLLEQVELLDRYQGQPIAAGFCSLAVRLRFRDPNNTLRDEQVEPLVEKVRANLEKSFKADLRC
jgi:phenylalanyl-tRNA synthetase beta chain